MLVQSYAHRKHLQASQSQEPERGRSRTPKATAVAVQIGQPEPNRHQVSRNKLTVQIPRSSHLEQPMRRPTRPPPKGPSPDRSEPGALEDAIHEAYARGDLRQCLQWVLEMQGVHLDWDDSRLDTVTEDDLCFSEQTGMGLDATPEERDRAEKYWAMRQAEDDEARRLWELTASPTDTASSRQLREQYEAEQRKRDARAQYFRAPRWDKAVPVASSSQPPAQHPNPPAKPKARSTLSRSLDFTQERVQAIPRPSGSRPKLLFPVDEGELSAVRSMWLDQGRKGFAIVEALVRPPAKTPAQSGETTEPASTNHLLERSVSSDSIAAPNSVSTSTSTSSSAPSALFSSVLSTTSTATSVSTVTCPESCSSPSKVPAPTKEAAAAKPRPTSVSPAECPLHTHMVSVSLHLALEDERIHRQKASTPRSPDPPALRRSRTTSATGWLSRGGKAVSGLVDLVGRLPTAYLPPTDQYASPLRTSSCPPSTHRLPPLTHHPSSETFIFLLPLRPPTHPLTFSPLPTLPRSPYCPLIPPPHPTPRARLVPNPQFLRLKALQNRVLWGLVPVPPAECELLADIARRHRADAYPGRPDVDRHGQMFTAREALLRVAVDGIGQSALRREWRAVDEEGARTWSSWWRVRA